MEEEVPKFKRGLELARKLKKRLSETENEIEEIKTEFKEVEDQPVIEDEETEPELEEEPEDIEF